MILRSLVNNAHLQNVMIMKHGSLFQLCNPLKMKLITMINQRTGYYLLIQLLWSKALEQKLSIVYGYIETYNKAATAVTYIWSKDFSPLPALFADFILIIGPVVRPNWLDLTTNQYTDTNASLWNTSVYF